MPALKDFTFFKNNFSDEFPTSMSLNATLASSNKIFNESGGHVYPNFELDIFKIPENAKRSNQMNYISGNTPSIFFDLLKFNNYKIVTGTSTGHLAHTKGPYIDFLHLYANNSFCQTVPVEQKLILFGYCRIHGFLTSARFQSKTLIQAYVDSLIEVNEIIDSPKFNFIHLYTPGHASAKHYQHADVNLRTSFADFFQSKLVDTNLVLNNFINNIKQNTTNKDGFVILIFGDHAPWLSANTILQDEQYFIEGRLAIMGACFSDKEICDPINEELKRIGFNTPSITLKSLFNILANNNHVFDLKTLESDHYINYYFKQKRFFKQFLYE